MTAPDQPGLRNPATLPTSGNDLRDSIRDAFHSINPDCVAYHAADCIDCTTRADAVMADQPPANPAATGSNWRDLRKQFADAIAAEHHRRARERIEASPEEHAAGFADAVMADVQPELDRRDREIEQLTIAAKVNIGLYRSAERDAAEQTKRAEAAEAENTRLLALMERIPEQHMRFGVLGGDETVQMLPCADWCYACKLERADRRARDAEAERDALRDRVLAYADQLHGYCSPHGVSAVYAEQLREVVHQQNGDQT